ncbi:MAG: hypothetical protein AAGE59_32120 [Cyanobacteria bacterium P01_F01_bin.86]
MIYSDVATKKPRIATYIDLLLKERFEQLCEIRKRSSSNMLEVMVEREVREAEQSGELPPVDDTKPES